MILNRQLEIEFLDVDYNTITGSNMIADTMVINRSICDGNLKLGGCLSTQFEIQLLDIPPDKIVSKRIRVWLKTTKTTTGTIYPSSFTLPGRFTYPSKLLTSTEGLPIFTGIIDSAKRQKNRRIITVIAYDYLHKYGNTNVYTWFSQFAQYNPNATIAALVDALLEKMKPLPVTSYTGKVNTNAVLSLSYTLAKANYASNIQAIDILRSANELMCCFGYCDGWGQYATITLPYKNDPSTTITTYKDLDFEEYTTAMINGITLCYGDDNTYVYGRASAGLSSCYYVDDNAILNCCTDYTGVQTIGKAMAETAKLLYDDYQYRPFKLQIDDCKYKLGDKVKIATGDTDLPYVYSFILSQTITGAINLFTVNEASGDQVLQGSEN